MPMVSYYIFLDLMSLKVLNKSSTSASVNFTFPILKPSFSFNTDFAASPRIFVFIFPSISTNKSIRALCLSTQFLTT